MAQALRWLRAGVSEDNELDVIFRPIRSIRNNMTIDDWATSAYGGALSHDEREMDGIGEDQAPEALDDD